MTLTVAQYTEVLNWCNRVRAQLAAQPVDRLRKGKCQEAGHCVLANTINYHVPARSRVNVDETDVYRGDDPLAPSEVIAQTPRYAERFIREFDAGRHRELVGRGWADRPQ